jgi:hypothetical protein
MARTKLRHMTPAERAAATVTATDTAADAAAQQAAARRAIRAYWASINLPEESLLPLQLERECVVYWYSI